MDKKDIYEHLAQIYLNASLNKKKESQDHSSLFKNLFFIFISIVIICVFTILVLTILSKNSEVLTNLNKIKPINSELALVLQFGIVKINFNFNSAKEEFYSINLNRFNLARFKALGFSVRKANYQDNIILKLQFTNTAKEKSDIYLNDIPAYKWRDYKINVNEFKNISDWSEMSNLSFIVEEWNTKEKKGIIYIDNIRFLQ